MTSKSKLTYFLRLDNLTVQFSSDDEVNNVLVLDFLEVKSWWWWSWAAWTEWRWRMTVRLWVMSVFLLSLMTEEVQDEVLLFQDLVQQTLTTALSMTAAVEEWWWRWGWSSWVRVMEWKWRVWARMTWVRVWAVFLAFGRGGI